MIAYAVLVLAIAMGFKELGALTELVPWMVLVSIILTIVGITTRRN